MIDSGASINIMPIDVMKILNLNVDTPYGKYYAMDNRFVPVVGIIKEIEFKFPSFPEKTYKMDITVVEVPSSYGILLSRQWSNLVGGNIQLDLSYAYIPVNGGIIRIDKEPRSNYLVEDINVDQMTCFSHTNMDNFQVSISKEELHKTNPINECYTIDQDGIWKMNFDGSCSREGNGAGIVFVSPTGKTFKYSFLLSFNCTNNIVEYEALLLGLRIANKHGIKMLNVFGDSDLIISQVRNKFSTKKDKMK